MSDEILPAKGASPYGVNGEMHRLTQQITYILFKTNKKLV
jgi:hypothetical protein